MQYITHRRFRGRTMSGDVNLPFGTICEAAGNVITLKGSPIAVTTSENAHQYFARNDDGKGAMRGRLTQAIQKTLAKRDAEYQTRWNRIWDDPKLRPYKRQEYADFWLWNHEFFNADIETLGYIARLIGAKEG